MPLEEDFYQALGEWKEHCRKNSHHSNYQFMLDCDAYRRIVAMGPVVLPLIKKEYEKFQDSMYLPFAFALGEIIPEFRLPESRRGLGEIQRDIIKWLDENMSRYLPTL